MNNKLTAIEILDIVANNWARFSKEERKLVANLFDSHPIKEIIIGLELLFRGKNENKIN